MLAAALGGCGDDSGGQPAWVGAHQGTALVSFETTAPGVCAITVQYPDLAPAALGYLGSTYVQVGRRARLPLPTGHDLGRSGDWHVLLESGGDIVVVTSQDTFDYRLETAC